MIVFDRINVVFLTAGLHLVFCHTGENSISATLTLLLVSFAWIEMILIPEEQKNSQGKSLPVSGNDHSLSAPGHPLTQVR